MYKNLRFVDMILESDSGNIIKGQISDSDYFNYIFLKVTMDRIVDEQTEISIDNIKLVPMSGEVKFTNGEAGLDQTEVYNFSANCIVEEDGKDIPSSISIDKKIRFVSCYDKEYDKSDRSWNINKCKLRIPYKSTIVHSK